MAGPVWNAGKDASAGSGPLAGPAGLRLGRGGRLDGPRQRRRGPDPRRGPGRSSRRHRGERRSPCRRFRLADGGGRWTGCAPCPRAAFCPTGWRSSCPLQRFLAASRSAEIVWIATASRVGRQWRFRQGPGHPRQGPAGDSAGRPRRAAARARGHRERRRRPRRARHPGRAQWPGRRRVRASTAAACRSARPPSPSPPARRRPRAALALPVDLRNEIARLDIADERTAGAVAWSTRAAAAGASASSRAARSTPRSRCSRRPTTSAGAAALRRDPRAADGPREAINTLLDEKTPMLVLADIGALTPDIARSAWQTFVDDGGLLLRFAGPRLAAAANDDLVARASCAAAAARSAARCPGRARARWPHSTARARSTASRLPKDVSVTRQLLAEPDADLAAKTWAALADGTPDHHGGAARARARGARARHGRHDLVQPAAVRPLRGDAASASRPWPGRATSRRARSKARRRAGRRLSAAHARRLRRVPAIRRRRPGRSRRTPRRSRRPTTRRASTATRRLRSAVNTLAADAVLRPLDLSAAQRDDRAAGARRADRPAPLAHRAGASRCSPSIPSPCSGWAAGSASCAAAPSRRAVAARPRAGARCPAPGRGHAPPPAGGRSRGRDPSARRRSTPRSPRASPMCSRATPTSTRPAAPASPASARSCPPRTALEPGRSGRRRSRRATSSPFYPLIYWPIVAGRPTPARGRRCAGSTTS